ncbi:transposase [Acinetobacter tandoii]|nr:transposase [Acinetobacter tandoii]PJG44485.1 transposase [Acinetobacter tandoii]
MNFLNSWITAKAINGDEIRVKIVPLKRMQNNLFGVSWVEVGKQIEFESGETCILNVDGKSFYTGMHKLYKLNC